MNRALMMALVLVPAAAGADDVFLKGGGRLSGVIVQRGPASVTLDTGPGRVTVPMSRVVRIEASTADLAVYRDRAARLAPDNVTGWLTLARWAEEHDLLTQARESYAYVLSLDPENAAAHRGMGHVWAGDRWATVDESYRARGYVQFEGSWVLPDERRAILEERAASAAAARDRIEAEARGREAEARARIAEAEARRAEQDAQQGSIPLGDYPYGGVYGGVYGGYGPYDPYGVGVYDPYGPGVVGPPPPPPLIVTVPVYPPQRDHGSRGRHDGRSRPAPPGRAGIGASGGAPKDKP